MQMLHESIRLRIWMVIWKRCLGNFEVTTIVKRVETPHIAARRPSPCDGQVLLYREEQPCVEVVQTNKYYMLVGCPTNSMVDEVRARDGYDAATLLGRRPEGVEDDAVYAPRDMKTYQVILFGEVYFNTARQLERFADFMGQHKNYYVILANGHSKQTNKTQNKHVGKDLVVPFDACYDEVLASIFPRRLVLRYSEAVL